MKKSILQSLAILAFVLLIAGLVSSCKPREKCPAYGKVTARQHQPS